MKYLILIVSVLALAAASCDVTPPPASNPAQSRCVLSAGLTCDNYELIDGQLSLDLVNGMGRALDIESVEYLARESSAQGCVETQLGTVENGATITVEFDEICRARTDTWYDITIRYVNAGLSDTPLRTLTGELYIIS